jgi:hypothetical protein
MLAFCLAAAGHLAAAELPQTAFTLQVRNESGEVALYVPASECTWDPVLEKLDWVLSQPRILANPATKDVIATLQSARVQLYVGSSPRIQLDFSVQAGATTTSFVLEPGVIVRPLSSVSGTVLDPTAGPLGTPQARATVALSVSDKNNDGAELRAIGTPGTGIFQARFNGVEPDGYLFATMLYQILCGAGGSAKVSQYTPPVGYTWLPFAVANMSTYTAFTLTAGDVVQGATSLRLRYVQTPVTPEPTAPDPAPPPK